MTADLSVETLQASREWQDILKGMKNNNLQPRLLYPARISFKHEGEIKKSQYIMNNEINEIKNTLEETNSRITGAEDRISEIEDRMVEINESERKNKKRFKRNEDNLRDFWGQC